MFKGMYFLDRIF